jgi:TatA/E family protein of Tat protein translocase
MLSVPHLIIIFLVALVVFGPEKLPELARNFGKIMSEFRRATGDLRSTFEEHMRDLEREADERRIDDGRSQSLKQIASSASAADNTPANVVATTPPSARVTEGSADVPPVGAESGSGDSDGSIDETSTPENAETAKNPAPKSDSTSAPRGSDGDAHLAANGNKPETVSDGHP